jgi:hypothetical protein
VPNRVPPDAQSHLEEFARSMPEENPRAELLARAKE